MTPIQAHAAHPAATDELTVRDYLLALRRRRISVLVTIIAIVALALGLSFLQTPVYEAQTQVLVPEQTPLSQIQAQGASLAPAGESLQRQLANDVQFAHGDGITQAVNRQLGFRAMVTITASTTADLLTFVASNTDKAKAAQVANVYADAFIAGKKATAVSGYADEVNSLQSNINGLLNDAKALPPNDPQRSVLQQSADALNQSAQQLRAAAQLASRQAPSVISKAMVPTSPVSPKTVRNGVLGLFLGLIVGIGVAFGRDYLDDSIKTRTDLDRATHRLPLLGIVPVAEEWRDESTAELILRSHPASPVAEAYRTLRTAVQFVSIDPPLKVLAVTSPVAGEGKTTTVANLALSFSRTGLRVVVIAYDLRRPRLHEFFGLPNTTGVTSVLIGEASVREAVASVPGEANLVFLPSGPIPPNPAEILSLDLNQALIDRLSERADIILLDCPPVLPVSDTLLISRLADGVLIVASARQTKKSSLRRACELLQQVDAPMVGVVLNRVPATDGYQYGYEYGYHYDGYTSKEVKAEVPSASGNGHASRSTNGSEGSSPSKEDSGPRVKRSHARGR